MCGICGIASTEQQGSSRKIVDEMCHSLRHRGPDERGNYSSGKVNLGHARLSIIDLAGGKQPLSNEDKTIHITYNGEIFNFPVLRKELLAKGHTFKTNCDTEVIVHLYEEHGIGCLEYLNGQFAFAIWDSNKEQLFLARDRVGIKTLYYYTNGKKIVFASELKAVLCDHDIPRDISIHALEYFFTYLYIPSPHSIYRDIHKLPPAHFLVWEKGETAVNRYWKLSSSVNEETGNLNEAAERLQSKLQEAVSMQLMSDVPLGTFLSGGIDSSAISWFAQNSSKQPINSFSIHFPGSSKDESEFSRQVAEHLQLKHEVFELCPGTFEEEIQSLLMYFDEPLGDSSAIPTYFLCKMARQRVTVCLSGDGGDELFAGYSRYQDLFADMERAKENSFLNYFAEKLFRRFPERRWARSLYTSTCSALDAYQLRVSPIPPFLGDRILSRKSNVSKKYIIDFFEESSGNMLTPRMQFADFHTYLPEYVLTKVDRMSMMNSLEVRVPFLDHNVVQEVFSMPLHFKTDGVNSKIILKKILENKIPPNILQRTKIGFGLPLKYWFKKGFANFATQFIANRKGVERGYLDGKFVDRLCNDNTMQERCSKALWAIMIFEMWLEKEGKRQT